MYSVNAGVPGAVEAIAGQLHSKLLAFESVREHRSMLIKRLGAVDSVHRQTKRLRQLLADIPPADATVTGIEYFADPPTGSSPVVYLAVESPQLDAIHLRLVEEYGAVHRLEGPAYTMHITLARGGSEERAERLTSQSLEPVSWQVNELLLTKNAGTEVIDRIELSG